MTEVAHVHVRTSESLPTSNTCFSGTQRLLNLLQTIHLQFAVNFSLLMSLLSCFLDAAYFNTNKGELQIIRCREMYRLHTRKRIYKLTLYSSESMHNKMTVSHYMHDGAEHFMRSPSL
jgi:hypothetical protein